MFKFHADISFNTDMEVWDINLLAIVEKVGNGNENLIGYNLYWSTIDKNFNIFCLRGLENCESDDVLVELFLLNQ